MELDQRQTLIIAILTLFLGKFLNNRIQLLRTWNLPEPVVGGILVSLFSALLYFGLGTEVEFNLEGRDSLLILFFATIGINARFKTLLAGGKPLVILIVAAVGYLVIQNATGMAVAKVADLPPAMGVLGGSISLSGGHGTAIAWAPRLESDYGVEAAMEIGLACATFGLVLGSVIGGPLGNLLISRHRLKSEHSGEEHLVGIPDSKSETSPAPATKDYQKINVDSVLSSLLIIAWSAGLGTSLSVVFREWLHLDLPDFVLCLFAGILLTNLVAPHLKHFKWPTETASLALLSDLSLGLFLAMSLMSLQLWTLIELAGPILLLLAAQVVVMLIWSGGVIFRLMGKSYDAAVIAAGYCGLGLGATPTAIANMSAITKKSGPSPQAFLVLPLVGAFFIDIANALVIQLFLGDPG